MGVTDVEEEDIENIVQEHFVDDDDTAVDIDVAVTGIDVDMVVEAVVDIVGSHAVDKEVFVVVSAY